MAQVGIIMGSKSDLPIMKEAKLILDQFGISSEVEIVSAHRTPEKMVSYAKEAAGRGLKVIIAGAGGAAHLPGMTASMTSLPVIGVPVKSSNSIDGWDSILSILQMPNGIPVATVALNAAKNAGILAARIIGAFDAEVHAKMDAYAVSMKGGRKREEPRALILFVQQVLFTRDHESVESWFPGFTDFFCRPSFVQLFL
jgi:5-(carboxyamino)imidazole ribonucleotide mutase